MQNKHFHAKRGFTIVELLVVIVVIGVLATITSVAYIGISKKAVAASLQSDLKSLSTQLEIYKTTNDDKYPSSTDELNNGRGINDNSNRSFEYLYNSSPNSYSLTATDSNGMSYYITSDNTTPTEGVYTVSTASSFAIAWGGVETETNASLIQTSDGGYVMTGNTTSFGAIGGRDMTLIKYAADGSLSWSTIWNGDGVDYGKSVIQTSDGGYAVTGYSSSYGVIGYDMILVKFTSNGTLSWSKTWGGAGTDVGRSVVQTSDGGYAVTGSSTSYGVSNYDVVLVKFTSDGTVSWAKTWGDINTDEGYSVIQTSDGGYAVTGSTNSYSDMYREDMILVKFTSDGTLSWAKVWGSTEGLDAGRSLAQTSDGGYILTGYTTCYGYYASTYGLIDYDIILVEFTSDGTLSWSKTWGGMGTDYGTSVAQTSNGSYAVGGYTTSYGAGGKDAILIKYTSDGTVSWAKTWGGTLNDDSSAILQASDGGYVVAGSTSSYGAGHVDSLLLKFNSEGLISGCLSPMCQSPTAKIESPTATIIIPTATVTSPAATVTSPSATVASPTATITSIVDPQ